MRFPRLGCLLLAVVIGCADASDPEVVPNGGVGPSSPGAAGALQPAGSTPAAAASGTTTSGSPVVTGSQPAATTIGQMPSAPAPDANGLPCDVSAILKAKCQTCHGEPLMSGPMKLISWADLQADSSAKPGSKVAERVMARINDTKLPMPPTGRTPLTAQEKQTLEAYVTGGAKKSTAPCAASTTNGGVSAGNGTGFGEYVPPDSECDFIQELRAHGGQSADDTTPFEAPNGMDHYEIFYFTPKWNEKVHTIRLDPIIDNGAILHHWLLYMEDTAANANGSHKSDIGLQSPDAQLLSGWAPGNKSIPLGRDIGLQTISGANTRFGIELHYNTTSNPPNRKDRSGARVCATKKLREHEASVHWLGTQLIASLGLGGMVDAGGTCSVQKESHIIAHSPHMHTMGRHMKTIINRKGGGMTKVTDQAFAFLDQQIFPVDDPTGEIVVMPGDVIDTTCTYDGTGIFTFGPNTDQEMCYNFVVAWPAGSLSNGSPGVVGGKNTCIDLL